MNAGYPPPDLATQHSQTLVEPSTSGTDQLAKEHASPALLNPHYIPQDRGQMILAVAITMLVLTMITVVIRLVTRWKLVGGQKGIGWDDWLMIPAVMSLAAYTTGNILGVKHGGLGKHIYDSTMAEIIFLVKVTYILTVLYIMEAFFVKMSILIFYLRLTGRAYLGIRRTIIGMMVFVSVHTVAYVIGFSVVCGPSVHWNSTVHFTGTCPNQNVFRNSFIGVSSIHVITDFVILLLPIRIVWRLQVPLSRKFSLAALFGLGLVACIASIMRLVNTPKVSSDPDFTWIAAPAFLWGQLEVSATIIAASAPGIRPLFNKSFRKLHSNSGVAFIRPIVPGSSKNCQPTDITAPDQRVENDLEQGIGLKSLSGASLSRTSLELSIQTHDEEDIAGAFQREPLVLPEDVLR